MIETLAHLSTIGDELQDEPHLLASNQALMLSQQLGGLGGLAIALRRQLGVLGGAPAECVPTLLTEPLHRILSGSDVDPFVMYEPVVLSEIGAAVRQRAAEKDQASMLQALADAGDSKASISAGYNALKGRHTERDDEQAAEFLEKAASSGDPTAQALRAHQLLQSGDEDDELRAVELYEAASAASSAAGDVGLAFCYLEGRGVERDIARASELLRHAVALEDSPIAHYLLGLIAVGAYAGRPGAPDEPDLHGAHECFLRAAAGGHIHGLYNAGFVEVQLLARDEAPEGVSFCSALEHLRGAADKVVCVPLMLEAELAYSEGRLDEAFVLYARAAVLGHRGALNNAAEILLLHGNVVNLPNYQMVAVGLWSLSALMGSPLGTVRLSQHADAFLNVSNTNTGLGLELQRLAIEPDDAEDVCQDPEDPVELAMVITEADVALGREGTAFRLALLAAQRGSAEGAWRAAITVRRSDPQRATRLLQACYWTAAEKRTLALLLVTRLWFFIARHARALASAACGTVALRILNDVGCRACPEGPTEDVPATVANLLSNDEFEDDPEALAEAIQQSLATHAEEVRRREGLDASE